MKRCPKCGVEKEEEGFSKGSQHPDGLHAYCRLCDSARARAWRAAHPDYYRARRAAHPYYWRARRAAHPERYRANDRAWRAAHPEYKRSLRYGIGPRDFWDLFEAQEGICPYCLKVLDPNHANNIDHEGGKRTLGDWTKVRGILHWQCNRQLQNHTEESLQRALNYIQNPPARALWGSRQEVQSHSNGVQSAV